MGGSIAFLRQQRSFAAWIIAEGSTLVGTAVSGVALPIAVYEQTGSAASTGLLFALRALPYLLFGLVAGPVADRGNRRALITGGNLIEGCIVASVAIALLTDTFTVAHAFIAVGLQSTVFVFSDAAVFGAVPAMVGVEQIPRANGMLATISSVSELLGPLIAGVLIALAGTGLALALDAVSFFVAVVVQRRIRSDFRDPASAGRAQARASATLRAAIAFVRGESTVATLLWGGFLNSFAFGAVFGLIVPFAVERLGLAEDGAGVGVLFAVVGVGSLLAGAAFARLYAPARIPTISPVAMAVSAAVCAVLALGVPVVPAAAALCVLSCASVTTIITGITYRQQAAPDSLRSSVNVLGRMIAWGGQPFGASVGALLASQLSIRAAIAVSAGVFVIGAGATRLALVRAMSSVRE